MSDGKKKRGPAGSLFFKKAAISCKNRAIRCKEAISLRSCKLFADHAAEGCTAARVQACGLIGVGSRIEAALVVADNIDAFDRLAVFTDGLQLVVNLNAVKRAQREAARFHSCIERGRAQLGQAERVLAEVGVDAVVVVLILTLDGFYEIVGRDAELLGQLLDGVGLLDVAGCLAAAPLWLPAPSWSSCHPPVRKKPPDPELNLNPGAFVSTAV